MCRPGMHVLDPGRSKYSTNPICLSHASHDPQVIEELQHNIRHTDPFRQKVAGVSHRVLAVDTHPVRDREEVTCASGLFSF